MYDGGLENNKLREAMQYLSFLTTRERRVEIAFPWPKLRKLLRIWPLRRMHLDLRTHAVHINLSRSSNRPPSHCLEAKRA